MFVKIGRTLQVYYLFSLFLLIFGIGSIIFYYWSSGLSNNRSISNTYEASIWLDHLKDSNYIEKIETQVEEGEVSNAYNILQQLQKKVNDINRVQYVDNEYDDLQSKLRATYNSVNKLILFSDISKVFQLFMEKVLKFEKFVVDNNWKTLSRKTSRVLVKLNNLGDYSIGKIEKLNRDILSDIKSMQYTTKSSVISKTDKEIINKRLKLLNSEVSVLIRYTNSLKSFLDHSGKLKSSYKNWSEKITPLINSKKLQIIEKSNNFAMFLFILLGMTAMFILISVVIFSRNSKSMKNKIENYTLDIIKNKLLASNLEFDGESANFQEEFKKSHRCVHRYMSLGNIFDKTLPFGAVLLDSNLNIAWANQEFYQSWNVSEKKKSQGVISWKYIHRLTNLGDSDPVSDSIQNFIRGVYQIKNKALDSDSPQPFELYVSPIEYSNQRWVMLFFYPLSSMHDAITEQSKSIISPIKSSLKLLMQPGLSKDSWEEARQDFFEVGAEELFFDFKNSWRLLEDDRKNYLDKIVDMEKQLGFCQKVFERVLTLKSDVSAIQEKSKSCILELKKDIISLSDNCKTEYVSEGSIASSSQSAIKNYGNIISVVNDFKENIDRGLKACSGLERVQKIFSDLAKSFEEYHYKIHESINHLSISSRTKKYENWEQELLDLKSNVKIFDEVFEQFLKSSRALDIIVSKMNIVVDKNLLKSSSEKLDNERLCFDASLKEFKILTSNHNVILSKMAGYEEKIIDDLRNMYEAIIQIGGFKAHLVNILDEHKKIFNEKKEQSDSFQYLG